MKELKSVSGIVMAIVALLGTCLLFTGCESRPVFADFPEVTTAGTASPTPYKKPLTETDIFHIGDAVTISFSSSGGEAPLQTHQETIKDDGRITPPIIGSVVALRKSPGELQAELQEKYNKYYRNMTVTVISRDRYYTVSGEVRGPGPKPYLGETDLIKAISAAGDFTEFANKKRVRIIHANGKTETINYLQAVVDSQYDVPIYPGDKIIVPRRGLFN